MPVRTGAAAPLPTALAPGIAGAEALCADLSADPGCRGIDAGSLDGDLAGLIVGSRGASGALDIEDFARSATVPHTLIRGYGFARHVRTRVAQEAGVWRADAVYTVSPALPDGSQTIDAEMTVEDCGSRGIPTV